MATVRFGTKNATEDARRQAETFVPAFGVSIVPKSLAKQIGTKMAGNLFKGKAGAEANKAISRNVSQVLPKTPQGSGRMLGQIDNEMIRVSNKRFQQHLGQSSLSRKPPKFRKLREQIQIGRSR